MVYSDNVSAFKLSKNPVMHGRSKHIDVRFSFSSRFDQGMSCGFNSVHHPGASYKSFNKASEARSVLEDAWFNGDF